jgi:hypothetical protein
MTGFFVLFGGILLFGWIIVLLDWLGSREDRHSDPRRDCLPNLLPPER